MGSVSRRDASDDGGSPWLVHVCEPDELGVERKDPLSAFGGRLVELAEPHRHVAADDDRARDGHKTTVIACSTRCKCAPRFHHR